MKSRSFTLVETLIAFSVLVMVVSVGFTIYTEVIRGTTDKQNELIQITSKCRLAAKFINYELTSAHAVISPALTEQRTDNKFCYTDKTDAICTLSVRKGALLKEDLTFNKSKTMFSGIFDIFFTRLDDNLVQYRVVAKTRNNQFEVISCVFIKYEK